MLKRPIRRASRLTLSSALKDTNNFPQTPLGRFGEKDKIKENQTE
jgi:hypothetical protein